MADKVYPKFKKAAQTGGSTNLLATPVFAILIDAAYYTYSDNHEFLSDIPALARVSQSPNLTAKAVSDLGAFDSADPVFPSVPAGDPCEAVVLVMDFGSDATNRLVAYRDTGTGLPVTPDGSNIKITVPAAGWYTL